ncbi:hypothetical protein BT96DRAFT_975467 [Gymnopus androsaceus JB14]|uniref:DUF7330 domain-containing protein n=1 Tax=Gymnopus androsaceus JB14 TaxID=1447944 RepID=A0A6A4HQF5_9AGAR|nr:hypothetical protein BT96DRAFT_975467 [Gymnopus androsaceus JB14]
MKPEKPPLVAASSEFQPTAGALPSPEQLALLQEHRDRSRRRKRLFGHIIGFFVLFFGVKLLYHGALHFDGHRHSHHPHYPQYDQVSHGVRDSEWSIPPEMAVQECAEWSEGESSYSNDSFNVGHKFELPLSSDLLFLVARGPFSVGHVTIVQSDEEVDAAVVSVITNYDEEHQLDFIKLCSVVAQEGENGIGIFTVHPHPRRHRRNHRVHFDVTVTLPKGSGDSPLVVSDFMTDLGIFGHQVADLADSVFFNSISLGSALGSIKVESLAAGSATMSTSNSPIEGKFTVRESLKLSTANAHINVSVDMINAESAEKWSHLTMNTANAPIHASVSLFSFDSEESATSGGAFSVKAHTAHGVVNVTVPTAPINSTVMLKAETALAPVDVSMHNTFEGAFSVHSTPFNKVEVSIVIK